MATPVVTSPTQVVIDANFLVGFCAKEPDKHAIAKAELIRLAASGARVFAPGVIVSETLFVLCKKLERGDLNRTEYDASVRSLDAIMRVVSPPPNGDASLIARAEQIRGGGSCRRTSDGIYIALAEELSGTGFSELVTFDDGLRRQAAAEAPSVMVRLLVPSPVGPPPAGISPPPAP